MPNIPFGSMGPVGFKMPTRRPKPEELEKAIKTKNYEVYKHNRHTLDVLIDECPYLLPETANMTFALFLTLLEPDHEITKKVGKILNP